MRTPSDLTVSDLDFDLLCAAGLRGTRPVPAFLRYWQPTFPGAGTLPGSPIRQAHADARQAAEAARAGKLPGGRR